MTPAGTSNELYVQNKWEENIQNLTNNLEVRKEPSLGYSARKAVGGGARTVFLFFSDVKKKAGAGHDVPGFHECARC